MDDATPLYRARIDFEFGGVKVKAGDEVPCHLPPWSVLLNYGNRYLEAVRRDP